MKKKLPKVGEKFEPPKTIQCVVEIVEIYNKIQGALAYSGYANVTREGILKYEKFPTQLRNYEGLEKRAQEAKKKYKEEQTKYMSSEDVFVKAVLHDLEAGNTKTEHAWYAEFAYWPGSKQKMLRSSRFLDQWITTFVWLSLRNTLLST